MTMVAMVVVMILIVGMLLAVLLLLNTGHGLRRAFCACCALLSLARLAAMSTQAPPLHACVSHTRMLTNTPPATSPHHHNRMSACPPAGPVYITIGDGGNREGLATDWMSPQPVWSNYRNASYGHGE